MIKQFSFSLSLTLLFALTAGAQWSYNVLPYGRTGNSAFIISNNVAVVAGGNEWNDSIRSLFISTDRAANFNINLDVIKPWIKSTWFTSSTTGIAVGYDGTIVRTEDGGTNFTPIQAPGNTATRHFNSVFFVTDSIGFIAGGWPSGDSIQTILKTTDAGNTWSIQRDALGHWLKAIYFTDANNGMAVGEKGVILKTTNGGSNWNVVTVPGNAGTRTYNALYAPDALTAIVVGGNKANDSIQTIIRTTDGGNNWSVLLDNPGPMLNSIDFANSTKAYIVGNRGALFTSNNAGATWAPLNLPFSINDTIDLYSVNFLNVDFGIATGRFGKMLKFDNPLPVLPTGNTLAPTNVSTTGAYLNGELNANGSFAAAYFDFGSTPQFGTTYTAFPDTIFGNTTQPVVKILTGLAPNTIYYYRLRAENAGGFIIGDTKQFYTGDCGIPNCSFEYWDTLIIDYPTDWLYIGAPKKVAGYNGSSAVQLGSVASYKLAAVLNGNVGDEFPPPGGIPFNQRPDSLQFMGKYNIAAGDTAFALVIFKKLSQVIYFELFPITGNTGGSFVPVSFPINFPTSDVPDTLVLGFVNTNAFSDSANPNSVLTIDEVKFAGTTGNLPNWNFEQWGADLVDFPQLWVSRESEDGEGSDGDVIIKSTDKVAGNFALKLQNYTGKRPSYISTNKNDPWSVPGFPVAGRHNTFNFYFKFLPENNDTLRINVQMFKAGLNIGGAGMEIDTAVPNYKAIALPFNYQNTTDIPDSARIDIRLGSDNAYGNSVAYFDNLSFDAFGPTDLTEPAIVELNYALYPNPAKQQVTIDWGTPLQGNITVLFTDVNGQTVSMGHYSQTSGTRLKVGTAHLAAGFYFVTLQAEGKTATCKLVISE